MDTEWGGWPDDDFTGDSGETADLAGVPDDGADAGAGGFEHLDPSAGADDGDGPAAEEAPPAGGGYLEDDPMVGFGDAGQGDAEPAGDAAESFDAAPLPSDEVAEPHAGSPETVVGADPDVDPDADWSPAEFPEQLEIAAPEPVDGFPWSDPAAVAAPGTVDTDWSAGPDAAPDAADLLDYAAVDGEGDPWAALIGSDDPAASSLGRFWAPGG